MNPLKKYIWLVDTVMRAGEKGATLSQISNAYVYDDEIGSGGEYNQRSFHRHRKEVKDLFGIEIECYSDGSQFRYRVADSGREEYFKRWLLDSIAVNRVLGDSKEVAPYIAVEETRSEPLPTVLQALKQRQMLQFDYKPFWSDSATHFQPHALKMFERRWYLIGRYKEDMRHIILALDRMSALELQDETYERDPEFDVEEMFRDSYGIILKDNEIAVEEVWLKVTSYQANYLRSLPLHHSQTEVKQTDEFSVFCLRVRPTLDFFQKLLSLGNQLEVRKPEWLREKMKEEVHKMMAKYDE